MLEGPTDPKTGNAMAREFQQTLTGKEDGAGSSLIETAQTVQESRFTSAVWANQATDVSRFDVEGNIVSATIPPKCTDNSLILSSGALLTAVAAIDSRFGADISLWTYSEQPMGA